MDKTIYGENNLPYIRIWIHLIWSTKNRERIINKEIKNKLLNHIGENAKSKNIYIDFINSEPEHVHATISLGSDQTISKVAQLIKGESSNWINKHKLLSGHFEWQDEYIALSISESQINKVRDYIKNQEEHHRKKSFAEEYEEFIEKYGFNKYTK
jgi:putative transposase